MKKDISATFKWTEGDNLKERVRAEAKKEERGMSSMIRVLLKEAMVKRGG